MTKSLLIRLRARKGRRGATALEYALVLAFVSVAVLAGMNQLGYRLKDTMRGVGDQAQKNVLRGVQG